MEDLLKGVKYVVFDFDDTLCIHKSHSSKDWDVVLSTYSDEPFKRCVKSTLMQDFMDLCYKRNIPMGLISAVELPVRSVLKQDWVEKNYSYKLENFCVCKAEDKQTMLSYIIGRNNICSRELLLVDAMYSTLESCDNNGFSTVSPIYVAEYVEFLRRYTNEVQESVSAVAV